METVNHLTIDFEDWYQGLTSTSTRVEEWGDFTKRLEVGAVWLLDSLAAADVKATFFIVGRAAEEHSRLVREIAAAGHEIAVHGHLHQKVSQMSRDEFRRDLERSIRAVESAAGVRPRGFRAPCFSITSATDWFWDELAVAGMAFDSSVFPIKTPLYGIPRAPREPYQVQTPAGGIWEYPVSTWRVLGVNLPFSGGFYLRALPYPMIRLMIRSFNAQGRHVIVYCHPWEFDPDHPRPRSTTLRERLSHYGFLRGNREKFKRLLGDFSFGPLGQAVREDAS
jgi:polysaccharide deacetylase family protein (PEP-CTERM system associated)